METLEKMELILQELMKSTKEIRSNLTEIKAKFDIFIRTLEEQMLYQFTHSNLEQIISQNNFKFEVVAQSELIEASL